MRIHLPVLALLTLILTGCTQSFDPALSGPLTLSYDVQHGEKVTHYSGTVPAAETAEILRQLVPRGEQHKNHLMQETTEATFEYNGVKTPIKWTRVKVGKRMFIFKVRGGEYVLQEPHSLEFERLLKTYGTGVQSKVSGVRP